MSKKVGCPRCGSTKLDIHQRVPWVALVNIDGVLGYVQDHKSESVISVDCIKCPWHFFGTFSQLVRVMGMKEATR